MNDKLASTKLFKAVRHGDSSIENDPIDDGSIDIELLFDGIESHDAFENSELAEVFDRYAAALDSGDHDAAEEVLEEFSAIGEEFRVPLRGLYLLGRAAKEEKADAQLTESSTPKQLGDFEIEKEIGRGGMGVVYAANQISLQRRVALKILPFTAVLDPRQVARFRNEAQAAASLHHPHIVPVYGVGCERGVHYYSMQLIDGQTLAQFIEQFRNANPDNRDPQKPETGKPNQSPAVETQGNLSTVASIKSMNYVKNIIETGARVAEAIHFAHEHGIVHRDIKPSNLLLDETGKTWVADFGLARGRGNSDLTSQGDQLGTLRYMSPEQAAGRNSLVDFRTDIYSLGATLYELLTLCPAFGGDDRMKLLDAIANGSVKPMRNINSLIPIDLETVIEKAMSPEPADRYESAQEFAEDLTRCLEGERVLAKRKTVVDRMASSIAKHKWLAAGVGVGLLFIAMTATSVASVFYHQRQREHAAAESARFYLQQAHKSVDRFGTILTDDLAGIVGTDSLRGKLLAEAMNYYEDFLEFADSAPELKFEQAKAIAQLASLYERTGDEGKALSLYETAIDRFYEFPGDDEAKFEQAVCFDKIGLLQKRIGQYAKARESFSSSLYRFESLPKETRERTDVLIAFAKTFANRGKLKWSCVEFATAAEDFEQALELLQPHLAVRESPDHPLFDVEISSAYHKIKGFLVTVLPEHDLDRAEEVLRESLASLEESNSVLRKRAEKLGYDSSTKELLNENAAHFADMQNNLAVVLTKRNQFDEAESLAQKAIEYWTLQAKRLPFDVNCDERLATAFNSLGGVHWRSKFGEGCDSAFVQAETILRRVIERFPNRAEAISRLAGVVHNRGLMAMQLSEYEKSLELVGQAIVLQKQALVLVPNNPRYQGFLKTHHNHYSKIKNKFDEVSAANSDISSTSVSTSATLSIQESTSSPSQQ